MTLERIVVDVKNGVAGEGPAPTIVLLHGFCGLAEDLAPFARTLGIVGRFVVPHGLIDMAPRGLRGRAWWPIDVDERDAAIARGEPRDLSAFVPEGLGEAREAIGELLDELARETPGSPLILGGFSQGGMLSFDLAFRTQRPLAALTIFSSARIAGHIWQPLLASRAGVPIFMSHGRADDDLSFAAAERFKNDLVAAGLNMDWCPFDGGHEIPLVPLRALKKFLVSLAARGLRPEA